jgi:hypothetical protein
MPATLQVDISPCIAGLSDIQQRQIPFAVTLTLTRLARLIADEETRTIQQVFDRPTPWTQRAVFTKPATKQTRAAWVGIKDDASKGVPASKYLYAEVVGGERRAKRSERSLQLKGLIPQDAFVAPSSALKLDAYGNVPQGTMTRILSGLQASADAMQNRTTRSAKRHRGRAAAEYFVGRPGNGRLPLGVWKKQGNTLTPVLLVISRPHYKIRFRFYDIARDTAAKNARAVFTQAMAEAVATAR